MAALPLASKTSDRVPGASSLRTEPAGERAGLDIPPPIPTAKATLAQVRASVELGLAQARAGLTEDADVVQARMRAKYGPRPR